MVHITGNFLTESPLSPKAREAFGDAIDQGWSDPLKLSHSAAKARILRDQALASLAENLNLRPDEIEILGEPSLGHFYSICGLLQSEETLLHSSVDRKEIFAIARGYKSVELPVLASGRIKETVLRNSSQTGGVLALQVANGETGVIQDIEALLACSEGHKIACDYSSAGTRVPLPSRWDTAFFDSKSWHGPAGIGILAIHTGANWKNPLPHIGSSRTPQSASLPLMIATAVALEEWKENEVAEGARLRDLSRELREEIATSLENCDIAGKLEDSLPGINSFSFLYVEGEELLRRLEQVGISVDSGSACTAEDLQPSHVLAAMGLLTHGNIRITLHPGVTKSEIKTLSHAIQEAVKGLRAS